MLPEELEKYIATADAEGLVKACESLSEAERKKLSTTASKIHKELNKIRFSPDVVMGKIDPATALENFKKWITGKKVPPIYEQYAVAELAVLALCPLSATKKIDGRSYHKSRRDLIYKILKDRKPEWIDQWLEEKLAGEWMSINWETLRQLIKNDLCTKPSSDGYIVLMSQEFPDFFNLKDKDKYVPLSEKLLSDPEIIKEEIWRLFEVETSAFISDWTEKHPNLPENYETWTTALCKLSEKKHIDRSRLLDASLNSLTTGFKNNTLSGFIKFHEGLKPSIEELVERQDIYLDLLSNQASQVVTFALKILKELDKKKKLNGEAFINYSVPLFTMSTKSHLVSAIKIISKLVKQKPDLSDKACLIVLNGLSHESTDVQENSIAFLEEWLDKNNSELIENISRLEDDVSPSLATRMKNLTKIDSEDLTQLEECSTIMDYNVQFEELLTRINELPPDIKKLAGIEETIKTIDEINLTPLDYTLYDVPVLPQLERIQPINDVEELIETVAHAIEIVDSPYEVERIMDGISRLCNQRPDNFDRLIGPIIKRIDKSRHSDTYRGLVSSWGGPVSLHSLIVAWTRRQKPFMPEIPARLGPMSFIDYRIIEIIENVANKTEAPLISMPTHSNGWIDPEVLTERFIYLHDNKKTIGKYDLIQAILRMAPENRSTALAKIKNIGTPEAELLKWALGAEIQIKKIDKRLSGIWVAAARARSPYGKFEKVKGLNIPDKLPDTCEPAFYNWHTYDEEIYDKFSKKTYYIGRIKIESSENEIPSKLPHDYPTVLMHTKKDGSFYYNETYNFFTSWLYQWARMIWPQNSDSFFSTGAKSLMSRIDESAATTYPYYVFLEPLFENYRPYSEMAYLLLVIALVSKDTEVKSYAIDALTDGIQDSRIHYDKLGNMLTKFSGVKWFKLNRLAENLAEVSRLSALHSYVIARTLLVWLENQTEFSRDAHHILALLNELINKSGLKLNNEERKPLETVKGSTKTAKLAKALLKFTPDNNTTERHEALLGLLENRLKFVEYFKLV